VNDPIEDDDRQALVHGIRMQARKELLREIATDLAGWTVIDPNQRVHWQMSAILEQYERGAIPTDTQLEIHDRMTERSLIDRMSAHIATIPTDHFPAFREEMKEFVEHFLPAEPEVEAGQ